MRLVPPNLKFLNPNVCWSVYRPILSQVRRSDPWRYCDTMAVINYDPLAPTTASSSKDTTSFHTLTRERAFRHPPKVGSDVPALDELVAPHIDSFNALIEDEGE